MPHILAKTGGSTDGFLTLPISAMLIWIWDSSAVARLLLSITSGALQANEYETTALTITVHLAAVAGILI